MGKKLAFWFLAVIGIVSILLGGFLAVPKAKGPAREQPVEKKKSYTDWWREIDAALDKGLPMEAEKGIRKVYDLARSEKNPGELVKAVIYRLRILQNVEEESLEKAIAELKNELKPSGFPVKPLLHSMLAEVYWAYYSHNRYRFLKRSQTVDVQDDDVRTWDLRRLVTQVVSHYNQSLQDEEQLKKTAINVYEPVLSRDTPGRSFRPTLFDFLAHRALDFFKNSEAGLTQPADAFALNDPAYLGAAKEFQSLKIPGQDTLSFQYQALVICQKLLAFHDRDTEPPALVDIDLKRLNFIYQQGSFDDKSGLYEKSLQDLIKKYSGHPVVAEIRFTLAQHEYSLGNSYDPYRHPDAQWFRKKAHDLCQQTIKDFPKTAAAQNCRCFLETIKTRDLRIILEKIMVPEMPGKALVQYQNIGHLSLRLVKTDREEWFNLRHSGQEEWVRFFAGKQAVKSWEVTLPDEGDFQTHSLEIEIGGQKAGRYALLASSNENFDSQSGVVTITPLTVSGITLIYDRHESRGWQGHVLERQSGKRLAGVSVQMYSQKYNNTTRDYDLVAGEKFITDSNGYFSIPRTQFKDNNIFLELSDSREKCFLDDSFYYYQPGQNPAGRTHSFFFTDRAIYRPGQTVYFKGILLEQDDQNPEKNKLLVDFSTTVIFYDVNGQKISELTLKTNEYGSVAGNFPISAGLLTGNMRIQDPYGSVDFSVEEYKRPKFFVFFDPLKESYRLNDRVTVKGKAQAYAGFAIDNAEVKYRVVRDPYFPWSWYGDTTEGFDRMEIMHEATRTNAAGEFTIEFLALPDPAIPSKLQPAFIYTVYADVTDSNGETRSGEQFLRIGPIALVLNANVPAQVNRDDKILKVSIQRTNLMGEAIPGICDVTIQRLSQPAKILRSRLWERPDKFILSRQEHDRLFPNDCYDNETDIQAYERGKVMLSQVFDTTPNQLLEIKNLQKWEAGPYVLELKARDKSNQEVRLVRYFTLFASTGAQLPGPALSWFCPVKASGEPGETAVLLVGSAEKGVTVIQEIEQRGKIVDKKFLELNNEQKRIEIPIREEHRGNVSVFLTFVRCNRIFKFSQSIMVPWSNKQLQIGFETFRDKLLPGQKEEWRLKISGPKGEQVAAEMLAALYDASLDAFRSNYWSFNPYSSFYGSNHWEDVAMADTVNSTLVGKTHEYCQMAGREYDKLNWFGVHWGYSYGRNKMAKSARMAGNIPEAQMLDEDKAVPPAPAMAQLKELSGQSIDRISSKAEKKNGKSGHEAIGATKTPAAEPAVRRNLNETAFFFPQMHTDSSGSVIVSFTIPEALSRWKFMALGHSRDLQSQFSTRECVTQKDLMVIPNLPRFLREKDRIVISAKVTNLLDIPLGGSAHLQLFNMQDMQPVDPLFENEEMDKNFSVPAKQSTLVSWEIRVPETLDMVTCRISAQAGAYTDGEEQPLPILRNRMLVTETLPLPVRGGQEKTFSFAKLLDSEKSKTLKHQQLTLEFTPNPAWYAVLALPYLMEFPHECLEQVFSRFYANSLAAYIVQKQPAIERVFQAWLNTPGQTPLQSNLEKNQELKSLLLQETPWVMDAQNQAARQRRIANLFQKNQLDAENRGALEKLKEGQMDSGAWPWFAGMGESRYITQHIVSGFAHLDRLGVFEVRKNDAIWSMLQSAVQYLDRKLGEDYQWLLTHKINLKQNNLQTIHIHYLYSRSYFPDLPVDERDQQAFKYFRDQSAAYWLDFNKYLQGMIALGLHRWQQPEKAREILKSIKEHALYSEEMGMYWKEQYGYYWYDSAIESQSLLIEAFDEILQDKESVDGLRTWLLKQKQTQDWKTTKATADACYALLLRGADWLAQTKAPDISLGGKPLSQLTREPISSEAGSGYFKVSWSRLEIEPAMGQVHVKNNNPVPAWGGLYWQYFEDLDRITPAATPLQLKKELFLEKPSPTGPVIEPVTAKTLLKIGDRLKVRIELRVDRNMEFVHLKDMRASGFEPENVLSRYKWQDGLGYYESTRDAATHFFIDYLPKGTYIFEYPLRVAQAGDFSNGITSIQCMYAPEFASHSKGIRVLVSGK